MKLNRLILLFSAFIFLTLTGIAGGLESLELITKSYPPDDIKSGEFYRIYLHSLTYISGELPFRYTVREEGIENILHDIEKEAHWIQQNKKKVSADADNYNPEKMLKFVVPRLYRLKLRQNLHPTTETLETFLKTHKDWFYCGESVKARQIFVEKDPQLHEKDISVVLKSLEKRLKTEPFTSVARDYYKSVGMDYNGRLGLIKRGGIPEANFQLFMSADETKPFVGPIEQKKGYLFIKVEGKYTSDTDPVEFYYDRLLREYRIERSREILEDFYQKSRKERNIEIFPYDPSEENPREQTAYTIRGEKVTFRDALERLPQFMGDRDNPDFYNAIAKKALHDDLIFYSKEAREIRNSPEFKFMTAAHKNAWIVHQFVQEQLASYTPTSKDLKRFYDSHKSELYSRPDLLKLLIVTLTRGAHSGQDMYKVHIRQKQDFKRITELRNEYLKTGSIQILRKKSADNPLLSVKVYNQPRPENEIGRVLEVAVYEREQGYISPVLIDGNTHYHFLKILERRSRPPESFEDVQNQLEFDYELQKKRDLLNKIYQTDRFKDYLP